jgi:hypothetical protein
MAMAAELFDMHSWKFEVYVWMDGRTDGWMLRHGTAWDGTVRNGMEWNAM